MGTSNPQSQSLQQTAGQYLASPYPTAPANLPTGLQGLYGPQSASAAPSGPAPAAASAVAYNLRTPEQIQAQVNQAMYGQFNPFVQPTPNMVQQTGNISSQLQGILDYSRQIDQQAQLPPPGPVTASLVDTGKVGQNFQTSVGQIQADEAARQSVLEQAPIDYEAAKAKWEKETYGGYIGKGDERENIKWNTRKQGELPPTKPGWVWRESDDERDYKFSLVKVDEDDHGYSRSGKPFPEYEEWFNQNVVMPEATYTPEDQQRLARDIFSRLY
jgi:hypothetical protein